MGVARHTNYSPPNHTKRIARAKIINTKLNRENGTLSWTVKSDVSKKPIKLLIDCGADITIVAEDMLRPHIQPKKPVYLMTGVSGPENAVSTKGVVMTTFTTEEEDNWIAEIHIVDRNCTGSFDGFLGVDFLSKYKAIIDMEKGILTLRMEESDFDQTDAQQGEAERALNNTANRANINQTNQQSANLNEPNIETNVGNAFYNAVESKFSGLNPKCTGTRPKIAIATTNLNSKEEAEKERNFNIQLEISNAAMNPRQLPTINAINAIKKLKIMNAASGAFRTHHDGASIRGSSNLTIGSLLLEKRLTETEIEPSNDKDMAKYIEDRTFHELDDEITKLKKISLHRLDIGPQAKQFVKYFGESVPERVPQSKTMYTIKPKPNESRLNFIMENLHLEHIKDEDIEEIGLLVKQFQRQFYVEGDSLAQSNIAMHDIILKPGTGVVNVKQFPLSKLTKIKINNEMLKLRDQGVVRDSQSPFNSPVFAVPKKDEFGGKSDSRTVHNYQKLNQCTVVQSYPIPLVWDLIDRFEKCKYFSVIDIKSAYHQIPMNPNHIHYTAFTVDYWKYEYNRMPMGLAGAPATMQAGITNAFRNLLGNGVSAFLDDLSIATVSKDKHDQLLCEVFSRLQRHNLQAQIRKCMFYAVEVEFLGFLVSPGQVRPNPRKVKAILDYPEPSSLKKLQSFLGMANYYRRFIKNYSHHAKPLTEATSSKKAFKFTPECKSAFEGLKNMLAYDVTLVIVDFEKQFYVTTDASDVAIGAVLSQGDPPNDRPIQFFSKTLTPAQRAYPAHERECLALAEAIKEFDTYIRGRKVTVITDSQCLVYLFTNANANKRLLRQAIEIFDSNFDIRFKPGKLNSVADALSRIELNPCENIWKEMAIKEYLKQYAQNQKLVRAITRQQAKAFDKPLSHTEQQRPIIICQPSLATDKDGYEHVFEIVTLSNERRLLDLATDESLLTPAKEFKPLSPQHSLITINRLPVQQSELRKIVEKIALKIEEHQYETVAINTDLSTKNIFILQQLLLEILEKRRMYINIHTPKIIELVNPTEIAQAMKTHHTSAIGGHLGIQRMTQTMKRIYNWHGMTQDIKKFVLLCPICQQTKTGKLIKTPMQITSVAEHPFDHVNLDFQGAINPKSEEGYQYIFVAADDLTKYSIAIPTMDQTALTAAQNFVEHVILKFGFPSSITTDNGPAFTAQLFMELPKVLKSKQIFTSPYTPKANTNAERKNRVINEYLRAFTQKKPDSWAQLLPLYMFSYNTAVNTSTGFSPFELLYGRSVQLPDAILRKTPIYNYDSYAQLFKNELRESWELARESIQRAKEASKKYYDKNIRDMQFNVGDKILVRNHEKHGKYDMLYRGPFTIVEVKSDKAVVYRDGRKLKKANKDHIKLDKTSTISDLSADDRAMINMINTF